MKNRKSHILFGLLLTFLLLYLIKHSQDSHPKAKHEIKGRKRKAKTQMVVGHHALKVDTGFNGTCEHPSYLWNNSITPRTKWQVLNNLNLFLYSAYKDHRIATKYLRIIAMSKGKFRQRIWCQMWFENLKLTVVEATVQDMWISSWDSAEDNQYYRPLLLSCSVDDKSEPLAVSVTDGSCREPGNLFLLNTTDSGAQKRDFVVCLKPSMFEQDITMRLLEWIELQFILGANVIAVYEYHLHPRTLAVLESYVKAERVVIQHYTLPNGGEADVKELRKLIFQNVWQKRRLETLAYNDCFYRHIETHKYVLNLDLDEAIIPLEHNSWKELLEYVLTVNPILAQSASLSAANVYFFDDFGEVHFDVPHHLHMLNHLYRSANFTPPGFAQKSFFPTKYAEVVSNHYALKSVQPNVRMTSALGKHLVQLHHYRANCPPKMERDCEENYMKFCVMDPAILRFKDRLIQNVDFRLKELNFSHDAFKGSVARTKAKNFTF